MVERPVQCEASRNLLAGLYHVFRNTLDHHNVDIPWHEVEAVIGMVNWALLRLSALSSEWTVQDGVSRSRTTG